MNNNSCKCYLFQSTARKNKKLSTKVKFVYCDQTDFKSLEDILQFKQMNLNKKIEYQTDNIKQILIIFGRKQYQIKIRENHI